MIKNYIQNFKNINPIYLIDFSISERYVFTELEKRPKEEIYSNINYLMKKALYFRYFNLYDYLKKLAWEMYYQTNDEKILKTIGKTEKLKKYA